MELEPYTQIPVIIDIEDSNIGILTIDKDNTGHPIWSELQAIMLSRGYNFILDQNVIRTSWAETLSVIREFGSRSKQEFLNFRLRPTEAASAPIKSFIAEFKATKAQRAQLSNVMSVEEIQEKLYALGFARKLKSFQLRDLVHLLSLPNGANFSVPGAGKTTVTFALHALLRKPAQHFLIVAPKSATQAWIEVVTDCMASDAGNKGRESFKILNGSGPENERVLRSGRTRFIISYDLMIRQQTVLSNHLATVPTHLVLDESHRMKAGDASQRGAFLLGISALPVRRDILTGTPRPQSASDVGSQLDFLWPGHGLGHEIAFGKSPKEVLGNLYVRTTKKDLELPPRNIHAINIKMDPGQLALYSIVRKGFIEEFSGKIGETFNGAQLRKARRSVMRLLQLSINPTLALGAMSKDGFSLDSGVVDKVLNEKYSAKMRAVMDHCRALSREKKKVVIWTIFTDTIRSFESALADLGPVCIHGSVPSGDVNDPKTREGKIRQFHDDPRCSVLIANPAAAGEGLSLHKACHSAIYADRSYTSTHYLQSIDRIHRLGLLPGQETNIFIYRSSAPNEIGSIDFSVSRRLVGKIKEMDALLNDHDLHDLALDEEEADEPVDYDIKLQDIIDLISGLESRTDAPADEEE